MQSLFIMWQNIYTCIIKYHTFKRVEYFTKVLNPLYHFDCYRVYSKLDIRLKNNYKCLCTKFLKKQMKILSKSKFEFKMTGERYYTG